MTSSRDTQITTKKQNGIKLFGENSALTSDYKIKDLILSNRSKGTAISVRAGLGEHGDLLVQILLNVSKKLQAYWPDRSDYYTSPIFIKEWATALMTRFPSLSMQEIEPMYRLALSAYNFHTPATLPDLLQMASAHDLKKCEWITEAEERGKDLHKAQTIDKLSYDGLAELYDKFGLALKKVENDDK